MYRLRASPIVSVPVAMGGRSTWAKRPVPKLAVFDMVGTTVVAGDEVPISFREAMGTVGVEVSDSALAEVRGRSKREAVQHLLRVDAAGAAVDPSTADVVYRRFQESLRRAYRHEARPVQGAESVFEFLQRSGVQVALNTGLDRETADLLLRALGWDRIGILGPVTGDDVRRGRPEPDLIQAAMALAGVDDPGAVIAIGDTQADLEAAAAAGVGWSIGVTTGAHARVQLAGRPHSALLETVRDVPGWLTTAGVVRER